MTGIRSGKGCGRKRIKAGRPTRDVIRREAIAAAVTEAEKRTSGEIVVSVVPACDEYAHAHWKSATLGSLLAVLGAAALHDVGGYWGGPLGFWMALPAAAGACCCGT